MQATYLLSLMFNPMFRHQLFRRFVCQPQFFKAGFVDLNIPRVMV
jgi:hypothetical protein